MNILFVTPFYFKSKAKNAGGMASYIFRATAALKKHGHKVTIIAGDSVDRVEEFEGIELHRVNCLAADIGNNERMNYRFSLFYREWRIQKEVRSFCKRNRVDIIQYAGHSGNGFLHSVRVPAVMRMSSYMDITFVTPTDRLLIPDIDFASFMERLATRRMNAVYAPSRRLARAFGELIGRRVYVIEPLFDNDVQTPDWSVYDRYLKDKKYFLFAGLINPTKGCRVLEKIIPKLLEQFPDTVFAAAGKCISNEFYKLIEQSEGRVIYLNELNHSQLYPIIQKAYIILNPTLADNLSNTCIEEMYFGKIVIGTDGSSCEQLITDGVNGFLAVPGDADSTYGKIIEAVRLPEEKKREMERKAAKRIARLGSDKAVKRLVHFYEEVIEACKY